MGSLPICYNNLDKLLEFLNFKFLICPHGLVKKIQILVQPWARNSVISSSYIHIILRLSLPWDSIRVLSMLKAGLRSLCGVSISLALTKGSFFYGWSGTLHRAYSRESCLQSEMNNGAFRNKARIFLLKSPWLCPITSTQGQKRPESPTQYHSLTPKSPIRKHWLYSYIWIILYVESKL